MQLRCTIQIGRRSRKLILASQEGETLDHLALKLAGATLFSDSNPLVDMSAKHPALGGQEFRPDLACLNEAGEIRTWIECGSVTTHKMDKIIRRNRQARLVVLKGSPREARNLREAFGKNDIAHSDRVEIIAFPDEEFAAWRGALAETVEIIGEPSDGSFNLVINAVPLSFDFLRL